MLLRKCDWHDKRGVALLLAHGADPNGDTHWKKTALQQSVLRDNSLEIVALLLDHGGKPGLTFGGPSAAGLAARRGRGDLLALFDKRGLATELAGLERLLAACALGDATAPSKSLPRGQRCATNCWPPA